MSSLPAGGCSVEYSNLKQHRFLRRARAFVGFVRHIRFATVSISLSSAAAPPGHHRPALLL